MLDGIKINFTSKNLMPVTRCFKICMSQTFLHCVKIILAGRQRKIYAELTLNQLAHTGFLCFLKFVVTVHFRIAIFYDLF